MLRKKQVLTGKKEFQAVYNRGRSVPDQFIILFYKKNGLDYARLGFLASKKVGNAIKRNRARRLMKEAYRTGQYDCPGYDIIFVARDKINGKRMQDVKKSMNSALRRGRLL
ncbi:MAG: ribonuclease P protein component [Anaerovoracaceae bacterium]